ncbi:MAG: hypothetical protein Q3962_00620 [Corynebacterium sp.]|nr:hypothetical protein [Corynebacterium sp.]
MSDFSSIAQAGIIANNAVRGYIKYLTGRAKAAEEPVEFDRSTEPATLRIGEQLIPMRPFAKTVPVQSSTDEGAAPESSQELLAFSWVDPRIPQVLHSEGIEAENIAISTPWALEAAITILGSPVAIHAGDTYYAGYINVPATEAQFAALADSVTDPTDPHALMTLVEESFFLSRDAFYYFNSYGISVDEGIRRKVIVRAVTIARMDDDSVPNPQFRWEPGKMREKLRAYGFAHCIPAFLADSLPKSAVEKDALVEAALTVTNRNFFAVLGDRVIIGDVELPQSSQHIIDQVLLTEPPSFIDRQRAATRYQALRSGRVAKTS